MRLRRCVPLAAALLIASCKPTPTEHNAIAQTQADASAPTTSVSGSPATGPHVAVCGQRIALDAEAVVCLEAGAVDLRPLRELPKLRDLRLDEQGWYALPAVDDATLARLTHLWVARLALKGRLRRSNGLHYEAVDQRMIGAGALTRMPNLERLHFERLALSDPSALAALKSLKSLDITLSGSAASLARLSKLERLWLSSTGMAEPIDDAKPLAGLPQLKKLVIDHTQIDDVTPLAGLKRLETLVVGSHVHDLAPLSGLTKLKVFAILATRKRSLYADVSPLAKLPKLSQFEIRSVAPTVSGVDALKNLERVTVFDGWLPFDAMKGPLPALRVLAFPRGRVPDLAELPWPVQLTRWMSRSTLSADQLAQLTNVEELEFMGPLPASKLNPLKRLRRLNWYDADWSQPAQLPNLESLQTSVASHTSVAGLAALRNLRKLRLGGTIDDLRPLAQLTELRELHLTSWELSDLKPLAGLTKLEKLTLASSAVNYAVLKQLPLKHVEITISSKKELVGFELPIRVNKLTINGEIVDATALRGTRADELRIRKIGGAVLPALTGVEVERLWLGGDALEDLSGIGSISGLRELDIKNVRATSLEPLRALTQLRKLSIADAPVRDLSALSNMHQLRELSVRNAFVADLTPLAALTHLDTLELRASMVTSLKPLAKLNRLRSLNLVGTQIKDLSGCESLTSLASLNISNTLVEDLTPLRKLRFLRSLSARQTTLTNPQVMAGSTLGELHANLRNVPCSAIKQLPILHNSRGPYCDEDEDDDDLDDMEDDD